jgi:hypothetical protein
MAKTVGFSRTKVYITHACVYFQTSSRARRVSAIRVRSWDNIYDHAACLVPNHASMLEPGENSPSSKTTVPRYALSAHRRPLFFLRRDLDDELDDELDEELDEEPLSLPDDDDEDDDDEDDDDDDDEESLSLSLSLSVSESLLLVLLELLELPLELPRRRFRFFSFDPFLSSRPRIASIRSWYSRLGSGGSSPVKSAYFCANLGFLSCCVREGRDTYARSFSLHSYV